MAGNLSTVCDLDDLNDNNIASKTAQGEFGIINVVGDGHCLLHAVIASWSVQLNPLYRPPSYEDIKARIFTEFVNNCDICTPYAAGVTRHAFFSQFREYLTVKSYNSSFGDLVPFIIANAYNIRLCIISDLSNNPIFLYPKLCTPLCVVVYRKNDHYSGIYFLPEPANDKNSLRSVSCAPAVRYTSSQLRNLSSTGLGIKRRVRKRLFALQIWRPKQNIVNKTKNYPHMQNRNLIQVPLRHWNLPVVSHANITGGLSCKTPEIHEICRQMHSDVFCCTETWCSLNVPNKAISLPNDNYVLLRRDRQDGRQHGGLACYVRSSIPILNTWTELDVIDLECMWITIQPSRLPRDFNPITIGLVYHPPGANDWDMVSHLAKCVDTIRQKYSQTGIILCGDFNHMKDSYLKSTCNLKQLVRNPTHKNSVIDLFYTNMSSYYQKPIHQPGVGLSAHHVMTLSPEMSAFKRPVTTLVKRRKQGPKERAMLIRAVDKVNWTPLYLLPSCDEKLFAFYDVINDLMNSFIPFRTLKTNSNDKPWITEDFQKLIKKRQLHFNEGNTDQFKFYRNEVNRERKRLKNRYYSKKLSNLQENNAKQWWNDIKEITGTAKTRNNLQCLANVMCDGDFQKLAEMVNSFFQSVTLDMEPLTTGYHSHEVDVPTDFIISEESTMSALSKINTSKAIGPDGIPNWLLKTCAVPLAAPICSIWNACIKEGRMPTPWKLGDVCPLPKVNPPMDIKKHLRPITLSPQLSKCLEWYPRKWIMNFIHDMIDPFQYGSLPNLSTITALAELLHNWLLELESPGKAIRVLFIDFQKAFDRIDHQILIDKMVKMGIPDFIVIWMTSFLSQRQQRVKLNNVTSNFKTLNGGVPQGTLLGPVTFLIHINDLRTTSKYVKYVDDTSIWEACNIIGSDSKLQASANEVVSWCHTNKMLLNTDKTKTMSIKFSKRNTGFDPIIINGVEIEDVQVFKLLGVKINNKLTWDDHIHYITQKASQRLYFLVLLRRAGIPSGSIVAVYTSIIRSLLEYAIEIWHPGLTKAHSRTLEHIQKRAMNIAYNGYPYAEALQLAGIEKLCVRRDKICYDFFTKMQSPGNRLAQYLPQPRRTLNLRHQRKFTVPKTRTNRLKKSPIFHGLFCFNN